MIIFNQYLLGYAAMLALYFGILRLTQNARTALLGAFIFIPFPDNLNWHSYVLTESFYCSILCFCFYFLVRLSQERHRPWLYLVTGLILITCFFSKPTSPALFIALAFPFVWKWLVKAPLRVLKFLSLIVAGVVLLFLANKMISSHRVMLIYEKGDIIFAMHELPNHRHHDLMTVDVPEALHLPDKNLPLLQQMGSFMVGNPFYFGKLLVGKALMYIIHIRPFWSWSHNTLMIIFLSPLYFSSWKAIRKKLVPKYLGWVAVVYLAVHTMTISITWADWDGRFFVPLIPMVIVLGSIGLNGTLETIKQKTLL